MTNTKRESVGAFANASREAMSVLAPANSEVPMNDRREYVWFMSSPFIAA